MPELSRFYGITIHLYYEDHGPPHFHVKYAGQKARFTIQELVMLDGELSKRVKALILEWAFENRNELMENWQRAQKFLPLKPIKPLV